MNKLLVLSLILTNLTFCKAQLPPGEYYSKNKKAIALYEKGMVAIDARKEEEALDFFSKAIEKDSNFIEAHLMKAGIYESQEKIDEAIFEYTKSLEINPGFKSNTYFFLALLEYDKGQYAKAKTDFESFLKVRNVNPNFKDEAIRVLANCNFAIDAMNNPVPFEPINMGTNINTLLDEYFPTMTADEKTLLYTRNNRTQARALQEDFLIAYKTEQGWQKSYLIGDGINSSGNEGAPCLSADGQLLFYVACAEIDGSYGGDRTGSGSCDIFYAQKVGEHWSRTYNLGKTINSSQYETQPSYSADGKTLYFVSKRPGGVGSTDIYMSTLSEGNYWTEPVNLGTKINTMGREESVFIHPDGKTLYFSSDGHVGMGGLDIFISRMGKDGKWGEPVNLGYPINTHGQENSFMVGARGTTAYFASNRKGGYGGLDLYQFELYDSIRPTVVTYFKGKVFDANNKKPLGAHFELIDLETKQVVTSSYANSGNGDFLVALPVDKNYALNVSHDGYLFYSENFSMKEHKDISKPFIMNVPLQTMDEGGVVELKNVFFETAKYDLKAESKAELDKLVAYLKLNKTLSIEIAGHTDNVGDKKLNQVLSQNRAKSVQDYLIANGIAAGRLSFVGYGDTKPKEKNDTDEHRAMNRRTEFRVVKK